MAENSKIEWTHHTFNPWIGCQKVGPGCDHCYAEAMMDTRLGRVEWGPHAARSRTSPSYWRKPLAWNAAAKAAGQRHRVFCASLADVFDNHASILPEWRDDLWSLISATPHLDWMMLTKRPGNIANMLPVPFDFEKQYPNVWLGCTVVNQAEADRDIPKLLAVPAAVRFLSMEPLLGPVDLTAHLWGRAEPCPGCPRDADCDCGALPRHMLGEEPDIALVIVGGESGPGARPMHPDLARSLRDQCVAAGVPFFFKQWGEWMPFCHAPDNDWMYHHLANPESEASRRCKFASCCLHSDGGRFSMGKANQIHRIEEGAFRGPSPMSMYLTGKARAGRLLDGRTWDQMPGVRP